LEHELLPDPRLAKLPERKRSSPSHTGKRRWTVMSHCRYTPGRIRPCGMFSFWE